MLISMAASPPQLIAVNHVKFGVCRPWARTIHVCRLPHSGCGSSTSFIPFRLAQRGWLMLYQRASDFGFSSWGSWLDNQVFLHLYHRMKYRCQGTSIRRNIRCTLMINKQHTHAWSCATGDVLITAAPVLRLVVLLQGAALKQEMGGGPVP